MGYLDENGYLFLTDRKTHMIISGGVNIYPQETENLLVTHPKVMDAAVIGVPDDDLGEAVKAVVQPVPGELGDDALEQELIAFCRERLAHFKCPRSSTSTKSCRGSPPESSTRASSATGTGVTTQPGSCERGRAARRPGLVGRGDGRWPPGGRRPQAWRRAQGGVVRRPRASRRHRAATVPPLRPLRPGTHQGPLDVAPGSHRLRRPPGRSGARPRVLGVHPVHQAMVSERVVGENWFSRIADPAEQEETARDFMVKLAALHALDPAALDLPAFPPVQTVADAVHAELDEWERVLAERGGTVDPALAYSLRWLRRNVPDYAGRPVLVQGDTGPGNFMYTGGRVTAVVDWELAHVGDPMDDIAWLSLRATQEPFTDFPTRLREYEALSGNVIDEARVHYYRVMAETKLQVMGHRADAAGSGGGGTARQTTAAGAMSATASSTRCCIGVCGSKRSRPRPDWS